MAQQYSYPAAAIVESEAVSDGYVVGNQIYAQAQQSFTKTTSAQAAGAGDGTLSNSTISSVVNTITTQRIGYLLQRDATIANGVGVSARQLQATFIVANDPNGTLYTSLMG